MEDNRRSVTLAADISSGQQADIELAEDNTLWVAAGPGIEMADIWMKNVAGMADLRVRIVRLGMSLEVSIDRGDQSPNWWPAESAPRLRIAFDPSQGTASAKASTGAAADFKTVEFGSISY